MSDTHWIGRMASPDSGFFYPDSPDEAKHFREYHDAEFEGKCPGVEGNYVDCTCSCWGCKHHCAACWRNSEA